MYVDQVEPPNMMAPNWLDEPLPLHATSGGKAFLAWLGRDERDAILPADLPRYTERARHGGPASGSTRDLAGATGLRLTESRPSGGGSGVT